MASGAGESRSPHRSPGSKPGLPAARGGAAISAVLEEQGEVGGPREDRRSRSPVIAVGKPSIPFAQYDFTCPCRSCGADALLESSAAARETAFRNGSRRFVDTQHGEAEERTEDQEFPCHLTPLDEPAEREAQISVFHFKKQVNFWKS